MLACLPGCLCLQLQNNQTKMQVGETALHEMYTQPPAIQLRIYTCVSDLQCWFALVSLILFTIYDACSCMNLNTLNTLTSKIQTFYLRKDRSGRQFLVLLRLRCIMMMLVVVMPMFPMIVLVTVMPLAMMNILRRVGIDRLWWLGSRVW